LQKYNSNKRTKGKIGYNRLLSETLLVET
jgi:hypothetical protein